MSRLFEGEDLSSSDENDNLKTNNQYAKQYDTWRKKEELNKLKTKYGEDVLDEDESSSSSDDEEGLEITEEVEKDFFKTLSCLKNKDPAIYKKDVVFFKNTPFEQVKKKKKDKPVFLKDYERNLILEKGGVLSDDDEDVEGSRSPTYNQEQQLIKESFKTVLGSDEENDNSLGGILQKRKKTEAEEQKEESDYKKWLAGQKTAIKDEKIQKDLKPLKEYWNNPSLDKEERFLRDYLLNKKYLDNENEDYIPTYEEVVHDSDQDLSNDEENLDKQEEFEHKYNFRYEEPDQEFIKRYPRTMENSLRKTDGRRKEKRQEIKERKKKEKEEKMQELKKMQEFKRKEIEEKLEKLKEITGNENLGFDDQDIDGEFDPEEHDRKMQALFNDQFYEAPEDDQKPEFPDLDEELEIENWERFTGNPSEDYDPHCEDDDFNMDCDYDPQVSVSNDNDDNKSKQKRRKKSKFAKAVSMPKPKFDPNDKKFEKYFEEYYKLDCEDIIGDIPCRFKYRKVVPNDFGLTTEEILLANERELNKWCSLKKAVQIRSDEVERYEQIAYQRKGQNLNLKQKILPSLFTKTPEEEADKSSKQEDNGEKNQGDSLTKNDVKQKHDISKNLEIPEDNVIRNTKSNKKQKKKITNVGGKDCQTELETKEGTNEGDSLKKNDVNQKHETISKNLETPENNAIENDKSNKKKRKKTENVEGKDGQTKLETNSSEKNGIPQNIVTEVNKKKKKKKKKSNASNSQISVDTVNNSEDTNNKKRKRKDTDTVSRKKKFRRNKEEKLSISDARLSAYGINPKKFKNKIKYKKLEAKK